MKNFILIMAFMVIILGCSSGPQPSISSSNPDLRYQGLIKLEYNDKIVQNLDVVTELVSDDPDPLVRALAAGYVGKYKYKPGVPVLIKALEDKEALVRESAVKALGLMQVNEAVKALLGLLADDKVGSVRRTAAQALGDIGEKTVLGALIQRLEDVDNSVAYAALKALQKITGQTLGKDTDVWEKWLKEQATKETK
jgi:HEAT repeat protein